MKVVSRFAVLLRDAPVQRVPQPLIDWIERNIDNLSESHFRMDAVVTDVVCILDLDVLLTRDLATVGDPLPPEELAWLRSKIEAQERLLYVSI